MTTDILLALALVVSLVLNAMQASKASEWRAKIRHLSQLNDILISGQPDTDDVHVYDPIDKMDARMKEDRQMHADWLADHPGVTPKPGFERKRR